MAKRGPGQALDRQEAGGPPLTQPKRLWDCFATGRRLGVLLQDGEGRSDGFAYLLEPQHHQSDTLHATYAEQTSRCDVISGCTHRCSGLNSGEGPDQG